MEGYIDQNRTTLNDDINNPKKELYSFIDRNRPTHTSKLATYARDNLGMNNALSTTEERFEQDRRIKTSYLDWTGNGKSYDDLIIVEVSNEGTYATSLNPRGEVFQNYESGVLVKFAADTTRASNFYTMASELDPVRKKHLERDLELEKILALGCSGLELEITAPSFE